MSIMKLYQLDYLYSCFSDAEEIQEFINKIKLIIEKQEGFFHQSSNPIKKKLGYEINNNQFAFLGTIEFDLEPKKIKELKKQLKIDQALLRFIVSKKKKSLIQHSIPSKPYSSEINNAVVDDNVVNDSKDKKKQKKTPKVIKKKSLLKKQNFVKIKKVKIDEISKKLDEILD